MKELYVIVVANITNKYLIKDGWKAGMCVCRQHGPGFEPPEWGPNSPTFRLSADPEAYMTRREAEAELKLRGESFGGVKFEVIEFVRKQSDERNA